MWKHLILGGCRHISTEGCKHARTQCLNQQKPLLSFKNRKCRFSIFIEKKLPSGSNNDFHGKTGFQENYDKGRLMIMGWQLTEVFWYIESNPYRPRYWCYLWCYLFNICCLHLSLSEMRKICTFAQNWQSSLPLCFQLLAKRK